MPRQGRRRVRVRKRRRRRQIGMGLFSTIVLEGIGHAIEAGLKARGQPEQYRASAKPQTHTRKVGKRNITYVIRSAGIPKMGW